MIVAHKGNSYGIRRIQIRRKRCLRNVMKSKENVDLVSDNFLVIIAKKGSVFSQSRSLLDLDLVAQAEKIPRHDGSFGS